jgi:mono/diheme cytochrome c family protein
MITLRKAVLALAGAAITFAAVQAAAQEKAPHQGLQILKAKCFQCHTDAMWRDARQDARAWEAAIYRMVGRGGVWTAEEIKLMADYLGTDFGPNVKPNELRK